MTGGSGVPVTFVVVAAVDVSSVAVVSPSATVVDLVVGDGVGVVEIGVVDSEENKVDDGLVIKFGSCSDFDCSGPREEIVVNVVLRICGLNRRLPASIDGRNRRHQTHPGSWQSKESHISASPPRSEDPRHKAAPRNCRIRSNGRTWNSSVGWNIDILHMAGNPRDLADRRILGRLLPILR